MVWLIDLTDSRFELRKTRGDGTETFRWYFPWRSFQAAKQTVMVDIGLPSNIVIELIKVYWGSEKCACAGVCKRKILAF